MKPSDLANKAKLLPGAAIASAQLGALASAPLASLASAPLVSLTSAPIAALTSASTAAFTSVAALTSALTSAVQVLQEAASATPQTFASPWRTAQQKRWEAYLDMILREEFPDAGAGGLDSRLKDEVTSTFSINSSWRQHLPRMRRRLVEALCVVKDSKLYGVFYTLLTIYVLFAADFDSIVGNDASRTGVGISITVACGLFLMEIFVQSMCSDNYLGSAYMLLDLVSLASLLPDTNLVQMFLDQSAFVAGRSPRLLRLARAALRSTRLARQNRTVRAVALLPRVQRFFGRRATEADVKRLIRKKLGRIFDVLDEDLDGLLARAVAVGCLERLRAVAQPRSAKEALAAAAAAVSASVNITKAASVAVADFAVAASSRTMTPKARGPSSKPSLPERLANAEASNCHCPVTVTAADDGDPLLSSSPCLLELRPPAVYSAGSPAPSPCASKRPSGASNVGDPQQDQAGLKTAGLTLHAAAESRGASRERSRPPGGAEKPPPEASPEKQASPEKPFGAATSAGTAGSQGSQGSQGSLGSASGAGGLQVPLARDGLCEDPEVVNFDAFHDLVTQDDCAGAAMKRSCAKQLNQGRNMTRVAGMMAEQVGVKVAFGILVMFFFMLLFRQPVDVEPVLKWGIRRLEDRLQGRLPASTGAAIAPWFREQVAAFADADGTSAAWGRSLLYLDIHHLTYCSSLRPEMPTCEPPLDRSDLVWRPRSSLHDIDQDLRRLGFRTRDVVLIMYPDLTDEDITQEELENRTLSVAVFSMKPREVAEGVISVCTTLCILLIIVVGVGLMTKDLMVLQQTILSPLVELGDDVDGIARLQMAGMRNRDDPNVRLSPEVQAMTLRFRDMRTAIRSWAKYVPWPVVQLLLREGTKATPKMLGKDVSMYFSDIAGFTTIVESLPPERSLVLLGRYLQDMGRIIDMNGGIVLEYIGDAICSVHGAPVANPEHPTAAVEAAVEMLAAVRALDPWLREQGLPTFRIRCGVHSGTVLVGNLGFQQRIKYGLLGEDADIPGHLEEMNKNYKSEMLISAATFDRLQPNRYVVRPLDFVHMLEGQGPRSKPVYQVLGRTQDPGSQPLVEAAANHTFALQAYRERDFEKAATLFRTVGEMMRKATGTEDEPSALLLKRCEHYAKEPPEDDWDGVWMAGKPH